MKLSEKGLSKFWNRVNELDTFQDNNTMWDTQNSLESELNAISKVIKQEFDPDDFQGVVVLSIDEAKTIANKLNDNSKFYLLQTGNFDFDTIELMDYLDDRIEEAEQSYD